MSYARRTAGPPKSRYARASGSFRRPRRRFLARMRAATAGTDLPPTHAGVRPESGEQPGVIRVDRELMPVVPLGGRRQSPALALSILTTFTSAMACTAPSPPLV